MPSVILLFCLLLVLVYVSVEVCYAGRRLKQTPESDQTSVTCEIVSQHYFGCGFAEHDIPLDGSKWTIPEGWYIVIELKNGHIVTCLPGHWLRLRDDAMGIFKRAHPQSGPELCATYLDWDSITSICVNSPTEPESRQVGRARQWQVDTMELWKFLYNRKPTVSFRVREAEKSFSSLSDLENWLPGRITSINIGNEDGEQIQSMERKFRDSNGDTELRRRQQVFERIVAQIPRSPDPSLKNS